MSRNKVDKTKQKQAAWISRTMTALDTGRPAVETLLRTPRKQSLRINSLQGSKGDIVARLEQLGWSGKPYDWFPDGYSIDSSLEPLRDSELVANGEVFIQNAASWLPIIALNPKPGEAILDVCAAPGGKTSHIAAATDNEAHIWANDNSRTRLAKLQANMKRLGACVEQYTLYDATALARKLDGQQFDKILLDAPCSGEGLMSLDNTADFATWSVAHIKRLQQLQKRLITQSWQLLKPGGTLVYSTCTMAPEENEAVVDYLLRKQEDARIVPFDLQLPNRMPVVHEWNNKAYDPTIEGCMRLVPSENIEAFFVCELEKLAS